MSAQRFLLETIILAFPSESWLLTKRPDCSPTNVIYGSFILSVDILLRLIRKCMYTNSRRNDYSIQVLLDNTLIK